jgi:signal peptidase I
MKTEASQNKISRNNKTPPEDATPASVSQRVRSEMLAWFWVALVFMLVNGTIGQARVIPSGSMENTLLVGDHLVMSRLGYDAGVPFTNLHLPLWRNPKRQQIVIFRPVVPGETTDVIKRVIGLPGDNIDIRQGAVWINGQKLREDYTVGPTEPGEPMLYRGTMFGNFGGKSETLGKSGMFPLRVPPDCYFVMGDNRTNSLDSRFIGCIPRANIVGTPVMIYMSIDGPSESWDSGAILDRFSTYANALIHPSEVRWRRLFRLF